MTVANDSILVTPGTGATVATHTVNSKEHQVVMVANEEGHILGLTGDAYVYNIQSQVHVNATNTVHWDFFNGHASALVSIASIRQIPNVTTAVTGVVFDWKLARTTAVGTGGASQTVWLPDTAQTALDSTITCRSKPTGGATEGVILRNYSINSEETNTSTIDLATKGGLELIPDPLLVNSGRSGILLRPGEGLRCVQITSSAAGNTGWLIVFTVN